METSGPEKAGGMPAAPLVRKHHPLPEALKRAMTTIEALSEPSVRSEEELATHSASSVPKLVVDVDSAASPLQVPMSVGELLRLVDELQHAYASLLRSGAAMTGSVENIDSLESDTLTELQQREEQLVSCIAQLQRGIRSRTAVCGRLELCHGLSAEIHERQRALKTMRTAIEIARQVV